MATETASISIGVSLSTTAKKGGTAGCVMVTGSLVQPQPYSGGSGVIASSNSNIKIEIPHVSQFFGKVNADGTVSIGKDWYRFFHDFFNKMGGPQGASISDLSSTVVDTRAQAISATTAVASVSQQVVANAQSLGAVVQVAQNNSLAGATQIPPVVYSNSSSKNQLPR